MEQIGCLTEKSNSADRSADQTEASTVGWWVWYGNQPDLPQHPDWAPMLSLDAAVIEYIVELLGPIEESAE